MNVNEKLLKVQEKLKAPKSQYNSFGKYSYRNAEDILEAVKPLCVEVGAFVILFDEIVQVGERYYVKSTARFSDTIATNGVIQFIDCTAFAREEEDKKGMDGSQITGSSSSYARKYALNGLFAIDDTKDSDSTNNEPKTKPYKEIKNEDLPFSDIPPQDPVMTLEEALNVEIKTRDGVKLMKELTNEQLSMGIKWWTEEEWKKAAKVVLLYREGQK